MTPACVSKSTAAPFLFQCLDKTPVNFFFESLGNSCLVSLNESTRYVATSSQSPIASSSLPSIARSRRSSLRKASENS